LGYKNFKKNHAEWCEGSGPMITRQPAPKGAKARIHEVENGKRNIGASFWRLF